MPTTPPSISRPGMADNDEYINEPVGYEGKGCHLWGPTEQKAELQLVQPIIFSGGPSLYERSPHESS